MLPGVQEARAASYKETHQSEYFKEADVRPAYYRVADKDRGLEARMVSSKDEE